MSIIICEEAKEWLFKLDDLNFIGKNYDEITATRIATFEIDPVTFTPYQEY